MQRAVPKNATQFYWFDCNVFGLEICRWELSNEARSGTGNVSAEEVKVARAQVQEIRKDFLKVGSAHVDRLLSWKSFFDSFEAFGDWTECELALQGARQSDSLLERLFVKFYGSLAKVAYQELEKRGGRSKEVVKASSSAVRGGTATVSPATTGLGAADIVVLEGERLSLMLDVIQECEEATLYLLSRMTQKTVAIDVGVNVTFVWGTADGEGGGEGGGEDGGETEDAGGEGAGDGGGPV
ncbi:hypothetical protein TeGR_g7393 [Tetraparma gracilis]|uniref:Uncharacterized protein n=1 Tax=Tetraparma gracilis TaxID=2962635 RepID=A0ABQ6M7E8_9STRA|nr:hypothetical protein TeGR_g7393 [Tetraparma gracilis]